MISGYTMLISHTHTHLYTHQCTYVHTRNTEILQRQLLPDV